MKALIQLVIERIKSAFEAIKEMEDLEYGN